MPYRDPSGKMERARSIGHVPIVENELVKEKLRSFRIFSEQSAPETTPESIAHAATLGTSGEPVRWIISFDGSPHEVAIREEYPSTRIGYIQVAGVLVHLEEMLSQQDAHLVDPSVIHEATQEALHSMVLPGSNVCRQDMPTVRDSWRAEVYDIFREYAVEDIPLIDVYMLLVGKSDKRSKCGGVTVARCSASESCSAQNIEVPLEGAECPSCRGWIYPTDALRIHEEVSEKHSNATALGRLMTVLEQITMVAYLHFLMKRQARIVGYVGFVLDGPLALFGPQAWLHTAILAFVQNMYRDLINQHLRIPVILGIEKSGQFAEHATAVGGRIPRRYLMSLSDDYIYRNILTFRSTLGAAFGRDTYYGQKFFYRTAQGQMLTITIPKMVGTVDDPHNPAHYPILPDTLALLDRIGTSLYKDAVIPVALAHSYASIPLRTGSKVLTLLSKKFLGMNG